MSPSSEAFSSPERNPQMSFSHHESGDGTEASQVSHTPGDVAMTDAERQGDRQSSQGSDMQAMVYPRLQPYMDA